MFMQHISCTIRLGHIHLAVCTHPKVWEKMTGTQESYWIYLSDLQAWTGLFPQRCSQKPPGGIWRCLKIGRNCAKYKVEKDNCMKCLRKIQRYWKSSIAGLLLSVSFPLSSLAFEFSRHQNWQAAWYQTYWIHVAEEVLSRRSLKSSSYHRLTATSHFSDHQA